MYGGRPQEIFLSVTIPAKGVSKVEDIFIFSYNLVNSFSSYYNKLKKNYIVIIQLGIHFSTNLY